MPKLSIVTVCYNEADKIIQTAESVVNQTFQDYEWIVIDGGSTDKTLENLAPFKAQITHFVSEPDQGIYHGQNKGWRVASGDYMLFLNGGDKLTHSEILERCFSYDFEEAQLVYGNLLVDHGGKVTEHEATKKLNLINILNYTPLFHPCTFIQKGLLEKLEGFNEDFQIAGDYDFFLKALLEHQVSAKHLPLSIAVFNTEGVSSQNNNKIVEKDERRQVHLKYCSPLFLNLINIYKNAVIQERRGTQGRFTYLTNQLFKLPYLKPLTKKMIDLGWKTFPKKF